MGSVFATGPPGRISRRLRHSLYVNRNYCGSGRESVAGGQVARAGGYSKTWHWPFAPKSEACPADKPSVDLGSAHARQARVGLVVLAAGLVAYAAFLVFK